jgi:hypothetical protein
MKNRQVERTEHDLEAQLVNFLIRYRSTPHIHAVTGRAPAELMLIGRHTSTRFALLQLNLRARETVECKQDT